MRCFMKGCDGGGAKRPQIVVWARAERDHPPAALEPDMVICAEHVKTLTVEDFITDDGRAKLNAAFLAVGKKLPLWSTAELRWLSLAS